MNFLIENFKHITATPQNVEQLKKLVLQLAVQGKLTAKWRDENPNVEPASVLLEKINAEKEQLIKDGKIKREKPLPKITDDEKPFELPNSWVWERLGSISYFLSGNNFSSGDFKKGLGVKCIKITNAGVGKIIETDDVLPYEFSKKFNSFLIYQNDIILALTRPYIAEGLKVSKCPSSYNGSLLNQRVAAIRVNKPINQEFVFQFLRSEFVLSTYKLMFNGKIQQPNLKKEDVTFLLIPIPPLAEQLAIIDTVEKLFAEIDQLNALAQKKITLRENVVKALFGKMNNPVNGEDINQTWQQLTTNFKTLTQSKESVKQLRQTILQLAVQGKLTAKWREENPNVEPASFLLEKIKTEKEHQIKEGKIRREKQLPKIKEEDKFYELPATWEWIRLGEILKISSGDGLTSNQMDDSGKIPVFGGNGINGYHSEFNVQKATIVIGRVGAYCGSIHITDERAWVTDNAFITYYSSLLNQDWLFYLLMGINLRNYARESAQPVISGERVYPIVLGLPTQEEQKQIAIIVKSLLNLCDELEKKIEKRDSYQERIMQAVVKQAFA